MNIITSFSGLRRWSDSSLVGNSSGMVKQVKEETSKNRLNFPTVLYVKMNNRARG